MKVALITTTINVPTVLQLYRKIDPHVRFFVAADVKTPTAAYALCGDIPNCEIYSPERQKELGYACSELIGWSTIGRRNIALLEALKWGADIVVLSDDDNIPMDFGYFRHFTARLRTSDSHFFSGLCVGGNEWFDVGTLLIPQASHRGFPHNRDGTPEFSPIVDAKVGVMAGICLGDPDIAATTRIANHPTVHQVSEVLRGGIVVDSNTRTVFNSQNTSFIRELAPCFLMVPQFKRYDDILGSLVAQRVMRERGLHVHFGQPFVLQQRNQHDLLKDLVAEQWGSENILKFAAVLDEIDLQEDASVAEHVHHIYDSLQPCAWMPAGVRDLVQAWHEDLQGVI